MLYGCSKCCNCGVYTPDVLCNSCIENHCSRRCVRCERYLPNDMFKTTHSSECNDCRHNTNNDVSIRCNNINRYSLGNPIGDRTWYGSIDDVNVSSFINHHEKDITIAFEIVQNVNEIIRYYFDMNVDFYRINTRPESEDAAAATASRSNVQRITSRFFTTPMTSDLNELNIPDIISQFTEKIDGVTGHNSGWIVFQINHLRFTWSYYRPLLGSFIRTPKWIASKNAITNVQCFDTNDSFQYSVLAGMNLVKPVNRCHKYRISKYKPYMYMLNMNDIDIPVHVSSIEKFENQNPDISVNILQALNEKQDIVSIYISKFGN